MSKFAKKPPNKVTHHDGGISVLLLERKDGTVLECALDTEDYLLVAGYRWYANKVRYTFYASTNTRVKGKKTILRMHQLLTGENNYDHKDRNGLNNTRKNLRPANMSQQGANHLKQANNKTGERGVYWSKPNGKYVAQIQVNGETKYLGSFTDLKKAAAVAAAARVQAFGEFFTQAA